MLMMNVKAQRQNELMFFMYLSALYLLSEMNSPSLLTLFAIFFTENSCVNRPEKVIKDVVEERSEFVAHHHVCDDSVELVLLFAQLCDLIEGVNELEELENLLVLGHLAHDPAAHQCLFFVGQMSKLGCYFWNVAVDVAVVAEFGDVLDQRTDFLASFG